MLKSLISVDNFIIILGTYLKRCTTTTTNEGFQTPKIPDPCLQISTGNNGQISKLIRTRHIEQSDSNCFRYRKRDEENSLTPGAYQLLNHLAHKRGLRDPSDPR